MFLSHPSTFITASDPRIFDDDEVVIRDQSTDKDYTPEDYPALFDDAGLSWVKPIADYYIGGRPVRRSRPLPQRRRLRREGLRHRNARRARPARPHRRAARDHDDRVPHPRRRHQPGGHHQQRGRVWAAMACYHFSLTDNPGVDHFELPANTAVLARLVADAAAPRSACS